MTTIFSVSDLECARNNQVLFSSVSFALDAGQILHIRGENGIGKTTLLRCLAGLSVPIKGEIHWHGQTIVENETYKQQLRYLGHKNTLKMALTVEENLAFAFGYPHKSNDKMHVALDKMGLTSKAKLGARFLSSGQRQRLAISTLLLSDSWLWILDEPFTSLDLEGFNLVQDLMLEHLSDKGIIIYTSHHPMAHKFADYQELTLRPALDYESQGVIA